MDKNGVTSRRVDVVVVRICNLISSRCRFGHLHTRARRARAALGAEMSRAYTTSSAVHEAEKWDLRLQRSNRRRTSLIAGAASVCLLFVISYVFTSSARVLYGKEYVDDGESPADEAALTGARLSRLSRGSMMAGRVIRHPAPDVRRVDNILELARRDSNHDHDLDDPSSAATDADATSPRDGDLTAPSGPEVRVRVHVIVERPDRVELMLVHDPDSKEWGPCVALARLSSPDVRVEDYKALTDDASVRAAAADALLRQAGLGQPPEIEFMQGIPATAEKDDGVPRAAYVALVRSARLEHGAGGLRGGDAAGKPETRTVPLGSALRGGASVNARPALRHDIAPLRTFTEPWIVTEGKDPKAACKDPRVAAARAAGNEKEAEELYERVPH